MIKIAEWSRSRIEGVRSSLRFMRALAVLGMDKRFKRNPTVASRLQYMKDYYAGMERFYQDPKKRQQMPPETEQQLRLMGPSLRMLEQQIKKNPDLTMDELSQIAQNPQLREPQIRTRPGPPMRGKRR